MDEIAIVLGTRPEIIKMSPIIAYCHEKSIKYYLIHSNQHYSKELDEIFFEQLKIPVPDHSLEVGSGTHGEQTGKMLVRIEKIFEQFPPAFVLVHGDTNTTLAGALTAKKMHIPVGHVEAGLRSHDRKMPEEINRIMVDHISDFCFVPTSTQRDIILKEGIEENKIVITGNTIVDAVLRNRELVNHEIIDTLKLREKGYFLVTIHRPENVDDKVRLKEILTAFKDLYFKYNLPIIAPLHPRTLKMIERFNLKIPEGMRVIKPQGYFEFLPLLEKCKAVITDSGGIQEEACILKVPCITARNNTERPETVDVGANIIAGVTRTKIIAAVDKMIYEELNWTNPFGDGNSAEKIVKTILKNIN